MLGIFQEKLHFFRKYFFLKSSTVFPTSLCGVLVFDSVSHRLVLLRLRLLRRLRVITHHLSHTTLSPTIFHTASLSHTSFHTQLCHTPSFAHHLHTQLCHTPSFTHHLHTQLCHPPSFTHTIFHPNFVTLHLCHTQSLSPTIFHTQSLSHTIFHTQSLSPTIFPTQSLSHTIFHTQSLSPTIFHTHLCHTPSLTHHLCHTPSLSQLCHTPSLSHTIFHTPSLSHTIFHTPSWATCAFVSRGRRGAQLCVASVALGDIYLGFAWQAWHLVTSTFVLRGRRGTSWHPLSFCVAGVALMALGWLWWRAWARLGAGDAAQLCVAGVALGDIYLACFCVAGVALGDSHLRFPWQALHLWHWAGSGGALGRAWSPVTPPNFAWQAWHLETSTFVSRGRHGAWWRRPTLRGRRGTWRHPRSFPMAGVACRRGTSWHPPSFCVADGALMALGWLWWRLGTLGRRRRRPTLRGRRGTWRDPPSFRVACVAGIHLRFAWQAWHLWHWAGSGGALGRAWSPVSPPNFAWQAWHLETSTFVSRGRHGTWWHPLSFCVAGVALRDIHLRFAWQSWHLATSAFVSRGRRGTYGIGLAVYIFLSSNELFVLCSHSCKWHALMTLHGILGPCTLFFCHTPSFTHRFVTHHLSHTTFTHTILHTRLCHIHHFLCRTPSFTYHFVTHNSSHTTCFTSWSSTTFLCLSFLPRPRYNICYSLLEEVDLWGYPVL